VRLLGFFWPFALIFSIACLLSVLLWSAVMDIPQPQSVPLAARNVLQAVTPDVAPTSSRPHLTIQSPTSHIQCFAPRDPALFGQTISVPATEVISTARRLCQDLVPGP
jgi:hypothetical protein